MPRLQDPETGLVVSCGDDLAVRYQSRGWTALDGAAKPAKGAATDKPSDDSDAEEKPARRRQARRN